MKATTYCPKCKNNLSTDCFGCIDGESGVCRNHGKEPIIVKVKWKVYPQTEEEYMELENGHC